MNDNETNQLEKSVLTSGHKWRLNRTDISKFINHTNKHSFYS